MVGAVQRESYSGVDCPHPTLHAIGRSHHRHARSPALTTHSHAGWELCVLLGGAVEWWVEDERWSLRAGSTYLTAPGERHGAVDAVMQPCRLLWCQVADATAGERWRRLPGRSWQDDGAIAAILEALLAECRRPDELATAACAGLLEQLVVTVCRSAGATRRDAEPAALRRIRARLTATPDWWPEIDELATLAGVGRTRLFQLARRHWHAAPLAHLNRLRLRHAGERLLADDRPITEIAFELGYASSQHFATAFKRASGFSPNAYRRQHMDA